VCRTGARAVYQCLTTSRCIASRLSSGQGFALLFHQIQFLLFALKHQTYKKRATQTSTLKRYPSAHHMFVQPHSPTNRLVYQPLPTRTRFFFSASIRSASAWVRIPCPRHCCNISIRLRSRCSSEKKKKTWPHTRTRITAMRRKKKPKNQNTTTKNCTYLNVCVTCYRVAPTQHQISTKNRRSNTSIIWPLAHVPLVLLRNVLARPLMYASCSSCE
jgi:hypothetical protein